MAAEWAEIVGQATSSGLNVSEIAELAAKLAGSGDRMPPRARRTADLASTGGPASLSTILVPPMLAAAGWDVPKLGVPGRPAGGVDVLAGVYGYDVSLDAEAAERVLDACGYVHVDAGSVFAPSDAALFRYRQSVGAQAVPDLAIASLLSKKLAMGVRRVGLEVRVAPHGNFGSDRAQARCAAKRFCEVACALGLDPVCILTDATRPFQPYVGRGEALLALRLILDGDEDSWLGEHLANCEAMAAAVGGAAADIFSRPTFTEALGANLVAQGGSVDALRRRAAEIERGHSRRVSAPARGRIEYDLAAIRSAIMDAQGVARSGWPDDAGVVLTARPGSWVDAGAILMRVRSPERAWPKLQRALAAAVRIGHRPEAPRGAVLEVVGV